MPELPEVETIVRALSPPLVGRSILDVQNDWPAHIVRPSFPELKTRIRGRKILAIRRRGKYLVFNLDEGETILIHLKMSGQLVIANANVPADKHVHTTFVLNGGEELRFRDVRKFGRVYLLRDPEEVLGALGPEPLSKFFTSEWLYRQLQRRRRIIKPLLLDQTFIAGIGNIYADEALFRARVRPERYSNSLTLAEAKSLHDGIRQTLEMGISRGGASIDNAYRKPDGTPGAMQFTFNVYGRATEPCFRCDGVVQKIVLGGRGTHFCISCQM